MKIKASFTKREGFWLWIFYTAFLTLGLCVGRYGKESIFYPIEFMLVMLIIILIFGEKDKK